MKEFKSYYFVFLFALLAIPALAQNPTWEEGGKEMKEVEIEIIRSRENKVPKANRLFEKISPRPAELISPPITYNYKVFNFQTPELNPVARPLRLKQEESSQTYRGYVSVGLGNYSSQYLDGFITNKPDKKKLIGAHMFLNRSGKGPVDGDNSGSAHTGVSAFAQTFSKELAFGANVGIEQRSSHFYGYPESMEVEQDSIKQAYTLFNLGAQIMNARKSDFSYQLGGNFSFINDKFEAKESTVDLLFKSAYKINEEQAINLNADYSIINRKDVDVEAKARNLFQLNGYYSFVTKSDFYLQLGATVALENDSIDSKDFHFYPDVKLTYALNDAVDVVGSLSGGMEKVSLQTLSNENIWLAPSIATFHTNKKFDINAGIRAKLGGKVLAGAGISFAALQNMYYFMNAPMSDGPEFDQSKFLVNYDLGTTKRTNFYASLLFTFSDVAKVSLQGDYYAYSVDDMYVASSPNNLNEAWHKPTYRVTAGASYNLYKKLVFNLDMIAQGGMKAYDWNTEETIDLKAAFDLSLRTEYLISDTFSAFVDLNNIASSKYPLFYNYPSRGFQAMAGITWKFK
jgi:hypothetical protein